MSTNPFDDLPDQIKEAIKEIMEKLQSIDPEELESMMSKMLGDDLMEKMRELSMSGGFFSFPMDPNMAKNFEAMMKDMMVKNPSNPTVDYNVVKEEEPYYEIVQTESDQGQIIMDLPGVSDLRQVSWNMENEVLKIKAASEDAKYYAEILVPSSVKLQDAFASLKNFVFILPFKGVIP